LEIITAPAVDIDPHLSTTTSAEYS
jgi:hypothetical protein